MQIRPAWPRDLEACGALDHSYTTDHVWQMEVREENGIPTATFRLAHLPREMRVNYPRQDEELLAGWEQRDGFLVAGEQGYVHGYVGVTAQVELGIARVGDLVVDERGIAQKGLLIRHLVLPGELAGTEKVMEFIAQELSPNSYVNVMAQYHPQYRAREFPELDRRITKEEYWQAIDIAKRYGITRLDRE